MHYADTNFQTMKRSMTYCICGFMCDSKCSLQMAIGSSWAKEPTVSTSMRIIHKNDSALFAVCNY